MFQKQMYNWAGNVSVCVSKVVFPKNEEELQKLVAENAKVRVCGSLHSWNDHFSNEGILISLEHYNKVIKIDKTNKKVVVQSGIKLWQLNKILDQNGLALPNLGSIDQQSIAGVISTATHGTGIKFGSLASFIDCYSLILADGSKVNIDKNSILFHAALVSLGAMGVISEVTISVTDAFNLHEKVYALPFSEIIEKFDEFINTNDHCKIWWLPPCNKGVVYLCNRVHKPVQRSILKQFYKDTVLSVWAYRMMVFVGNMRPSLRPSINHLLTAQFDKQSQRIDKSYRVFRVPTPPKHRETEWAFELAKAKQVLQEYYTLIRESKFTFNFIQEIRVSSIDDFWISPAYGRNTLWIGTYNHYDKQWYSILNFFEQFAIKHNARPHWGKEFNVGNSYLKMQYEKFDDFVGLMNSLDPKGKFANPLLNRIFR